MAVIANADIWRLRVICYTPTQVSVNVYHFRCTGIAGTGGTDAQAATYFDTLIHNAYKQVMSDDARYRGVSIQRVSPLPPTRPAIVTANDGPGAVVGEILPSQVAGIISFGTDFAGRKQRGRVYLPFPSEADNELPGQPQLAYVTAAQALANLIAATHSVGAGANTSNLQAVIFHRSTVSTDVITHKVGKQMWATQRRRGVYGRLNKLPF